MHSGGVKDPQNSRTRQSAFLCVLSCLSFHSGIKPYPPIAVRGARTWLFMSGPTLKKCGLNTPCRGIMIRTDSPTGRKAEDAASLSPAEHKGSAVRFARPARKEVHIFFCGSSDLPQLIFICSCACFLLRPAARLPYLCFNITDPSGIIRPFFSLRSRNL